WDIQVRVDSGHKTAAKQSTDHSSSTFLFIRRDTFRILNLFNFFLSPKSLQNVSPKLGHAFYNTFFLRW
ncbi:hypothetical protein CI726_23025, partial [Shigella sonnei]